MSGRQLFRERLQAGAKAGNLLQAIYESSLAEREERDELSQELAALHNEGLIDVVAAFEGLKNSAAGGPDFFLTRHVFEKALPHLNTAVVPVMRCVLSLCREAGQDGAAGTILNGYIEFCSQEPGRPNEALTHIEAHPELIDMLPATVSAGSRFDVEYYLAELIRLTRNTDIEIRRRAVFSISSLHWGHDKKVTEASISTLENVVAEESDDHILASSIRAAFSLHDQETDFEHRIIPVISKALTKGKELSLHAASALLLNANGLTPSLLELLLSHLGKVNPENKGTLDNIDYGISHLLKRDDPEPALKFLEELLIAHGNAIDIKTFDSAAANIRQSAPLLSKVITRWFLSRERALWESAHELGDSHYGNDMGIEIDPSELKPADFARTLFIARKAVGYFFMRPVTAASVVISLMRHAPDDEVLGALGDLLFDPLLLNYPGNACDYVTEQVGLESGRVKETIAKALASLKQYQDTLRSVPNLPALHPGQSQRESYRRHMSESMAETMKAAEKKSFFLNLFKRSTLLYGNKSINYIHSGNGEPRRMETPLASHGVSMEFPRMQDIDPYSLDYMLRVFRLERFRA